MVRQKSLYPILSIVLAGTTGFSILYAIAEEQDTAAEVETTGSAGQAAYQEAQLRLAEALVKQAVEKNRTVPGLVAPEELERLQLNVKLSQELLAEARQGNRNLSDDFFLKFCGDQVSSIKSKLAKAVEVRNTLPTGVSEFEIEVLKARLELAELELSRGRAALKQSSKNEVQWKLNILLKEVLRLSREANQYEPR